MKKQYKFGGNTNVPTGKKIKADLGLEKTMNSIGQSFLYPGIEQSVVTASKPTKKDEGVPVPYRPVEEQEVINTTPVKPAQQFTIPSNNGIFGKVGSLESAFNKAYPTVNINVPKVTVPVMNRAQSSSTSTQSNNITSGSTAKSTTTKSNLTNKPKLNFDFLNEVTNPDGSTTNLRTGETYFKDIYKARRSPYSTLNLKTGETEYAGFINPYGAELQSAVYNNGPQGRQERTTKERLLNAGDWINIGVNSAGALTNLITGLATPNIKYARMKDPIAVTAPKINTNVNTTAETNAVNEEYNDTLRAIDQNTSSSQVALNRKRNAAAKRSASNVKINAAAENIRRDLQNKDAILKGEYAKYNAQRQDQVDAYNAQAKAAEFNANRTKVGDAITGFVSDIAQGATGIVNTVEKRQADRVNTVLSYMGNPEVNPKKFGEGFNKIYEELYGTKPPKYISKKYNKNA